MRRTRQVVTFARDARSLLRLPQRLAAIRRHQRAMSVAAAATALLICLVVWLVAGSALQNWAVGLGMDDERGALIATLLIVALGAAATAMASGRTGAPRAGAALAFLALEIGPFLVRGNRVHTTPGLSAHLTLAGWFVQPIGMLLLAGVAISLGAAGGVLARRDLAVLVRLVRSRIGARAALPVAGALLYLGVGGGTVALQDGPVSALYSYSQPVMVRPSSPPPVAPAPPPPTPVPHTPDPAPEPAVPDPTLAPGAGVQPPPGRLVSAPTRVSRGPVRTPAPPPPPSQHRPGVSNIDTMLIGGRQVNVYVPAIYDSSPNRAFPVIYLLHGYAGNADQWLGSGAQLPSVLDQMIGSGQMPAVLAIQPDGNGQVHSDAEWGDARGDYVERWLTTQVVPGIDGRYRTLGAPYRGIAGLSAGGYGAVNVALHRPDLFRWAASYSGYFTARPDIFGPAAPANSPDQTASRLPAAQRMPLFIGVGDTDREYLDAHHRFVTQLAGLGWAPVHSEMVAGGHGWEAWRVEMVSSLRWLGTLWGPAPGVPPAAPKPSPPPPASAPPLPSPSASAPPASAAPSPSPSASAPPASAAPSPSPSASAPPASAPPSPSPSASAPPAPLAAGRP